MTKLPTTPGKDVEDIKKDQALAELDPCREWGEIPIVSSCSVLRKCPRFTMIYW
jgi:hypothetical protein